MTRHNNTVFSLVHPRFSCRLLQILDQDSSQGRGEPFQTYEALDQAARGLANNLQASRAALAAACRDQYFRMTQLQGHCEALHRAVSAEFKELVLRPQVCPAASADQELLCPNAQVGWFHFMSRTIFSSLTKSNTFPKKSLT